MLSRADLCYCLTDVFYNINKPTSVEVISTFLQHDRSLAVRILELMSQTQGNFTHYKEIFLLALMLTTPKEINDNKLLVCPGSIRKFNIEQLLMFGADVHVTYYNGQTLLMSACLYGTPELVKVVLAIGPLSSQVYTEDNTGKTCHDYAAANTNYSQEILTLLREI